MKLKLLLFSLLFFTSTLFSQTILEKSKIINKTNVAKLLEFSKVKKAQAIKDKEIAVSLAKVKGWKVFIQTQKSYSELIRIDKQGNPIYFSTKNHGAGLTARTNHLYAGGSLGINVEGQSMLAGEWDGGGVRLSHELFEGRVSQMDSPSSTHYHATHVAGTIIGTDQVQSGNARGMAFKANLHAYDWTNDTAEVATAAANGLLISNHSYGYNPSSLPLHRFGKYDNDSNGFDAVMYDAPYYLFVAAAGNTRNDGINTGDGGYDLLTGHSVSKNSMVVAAVNEQTNYTGPSSVVMSSFSSWGPTDDGRIKPDISAKGVSTYSATDTGDTNYITISGTSMASPSTTGTLLLLQQYYNQQNSVFMLSSTLRGLALHTADEAGNNPGPDYEFGWGLINAKKATEVIRDNDLFSHISENTLNQGESFSFSFDALGTEPVMASICWTDPAGTIVTSTVEDFYQTALVNDLDVRITKDGTTYYPWKMDKDNHSAAASKGDNIVDNIEKVEITSPVGSYTLTVTHKGTLQSGSQNFSLIVSGISFNDFYVTSSEIEQEICEGDNTTTYNLELSTIAGFSDTVTFSTINLPTGVNAVFTPTTLSAAGTFNVNLTNLSSLTAGNYPFTIHGQTATDSADLEMSLQVFSAGFSAITMNEPANNATSVQTDITFHWDEDPNAEEYDIEIATDASFTNIVDSATVSEIPYQSAVLTYNTTYYWRVLPKNNCGIGAFSSEYSFTTTCVGPSNIVFTNINTDSVEVSWTENSGGTSWEVEVVEYGNSPTGVGTTVSTNPYSISSLTSSTNYTVYVRSNCGSGNFSEWTASNQFTTSADFCNGDHFYDTGGVSGNYSNYEDYTITMIPSSGNNTVQVVFNNFQLESCCDYLSIYDGVDTSAPLLGSYNGTTNPGSFTSTNASGSLTFRFTSDSSVTRSGWDATVTCLNITCPNPTDVVTSSISVESVNLNWTAGDSETTWEVEYGVQGYTQGSGTIVSTTNNPYALTGLTQDTAYDVYIRANCGTNPGDDDSEWVGPVSFTTQISCATPTDFSTSNRSYTTIDLNWTTGDSETAWEIEYGNQGYTQGSGITVSTTSNPLTLTGLVFDTSYDAYLRANCGANPGDDDSNWVGPISFATLGMVDPGNLVANIDQQTGEVVLNWEENSGISEDFNDGVADNWVSVLGNWNASGGTYNATSSTHMSSSYYDQDFSNFELEVKMRKTIGGDCNIGIYFNGDPSSYSSSGDWLNAYKFAYCTSGNWSLFKTVNGSWTSLQSWTTSSDLNTGLGQWNTIKIIYADAYIDVYINDVLQGSYYDTTFVSGKVGLEMYDSSINGSAEFDDFVLTDLSTTYNFGTVNQSATRNVFASANCINNSQCAEEIIDTIIAPIPPIANYTYTANETQDFSNYNIYRDATNIATTTVTTHTDNLTTYGTYTYYVTTLYDEGESDASNTVTVVYEGVPDISVSPTSLTETLPEGDSSTQTITITNSGDAALNYEISSTEVTILNTVEGIWTTTEDNTTYELGNSLNTQYNPGFSKKVYNTVFDDLNILVLEIASDYNFYVDALTNLGLSHTFVSSFSNLASEMDNGTAWDLIIVNVYGGSPTTGELDKLNIYQSNGGMLIYADWGVQYYASHEILASFGVNFVSSINTPINFSAPNNTGHPIFNIPNQINTLNVTDNQGAIDGQLVNVINDATQLTTFDGHPSNGAMVLNTAKNCIFNAFQAVNYAGDTNSNGKPDMVELIENQISFLTGSLWLSTNPTTGTVASGASVDIDVHFDATNLTAGVYNATLDISSNDPDESVVTVPVELTVVPPSCPNPTNLTTSNITSNSVDLNWIIGSSETAWEIEYGAQGYTQGTGTIISTTTNPFSLTGLNSNTDYDVYVRANCGTNPGDDDSNWFGPISFSSLADYCNGDHFYDTGGASANYSNNEDYTITITPNAGYNAVEVVFNTFQLEICCDYLKIYDGVDTSAPLLGSFNGSANPGSFISSNSSGSLTFKFTSDSSGIYSGWDATVTCLNTAGIDDLSTYNFTYYPNPVKDTLYVKAEKAITSISLYSVLGQELMHIKPNNQSEMVIDLSNLSVGTYFMKVEIDGKHASTKLIKN